MMLRSFALAPRTSLRLGALLLALGSSSGQAAGLYTAIAKDGSRISWSDSDSKFDPSVVEIQHPDGRKQRFVGIAPIIGGLTILASSDEPGASTSAPPLKGSYRYGAQGNLTCVKACKGLEKGLVFRKGSAS
jgi:hypothetical protein